MLSSPGFMTQATISVEISAAAIGGSAHADGGDQRKKRAATDSDIVRGYAELQKESIKLLQAEEFNGHSSGPLLATQLEMNSSSE